MAWKSAINTLTSWKVREKILGLLNHAKYFKEAIVVLVLIASLPLLTFHALPDHGKSILALSRSKPWGILTSWLVHEDEEHLYSNIQGILTWGLLVLTSSTLITALTHKTRNLEPRHVANRLKEAFILTILISQITPTTIQYLFWLTKTEKEIECMGSSLIAYGLYGLLVPVTILLAALVATALPTPKPKKKRRIRLPSIDPSLPFILASELFLLSFSKSGKFLTFLGAGIPKANIPGHAIALLVGCLVSTLYLAILVHEVSMRWTLEIRIVIMNEINNYFKHIQIKENLTKYREVITILIISILLAITAYSTQSIHLIIKPLLTGYLNAYEMLTENYGIALIVVTSVAILIVEMLGNVKEITFKAHKLLLAIISLPVTHIAAGYIFNIGVESINMPPREALKTYPSRITLENLQYIDLGMAITLAYLLETLSYVSASYMISLILPREILRNYIRHLREIILKPLRAIILVIFLTVLSFTFMLIILVHGEPSLTSIIITAIFSKIIETSLYHLPIFLSLLGMLLTPYQALKHDAE